MASKGIPSLAASAHGDGSGWEQLTPLPGKALRYANARSGVTALVMISAAVAGSSFLTGTARALLLALVVPAFAAITLFDALVFNPMQHRWAGYRVQPDSVVLATGRVVRSVTTIDGSKILAVDTVQGPLLRSMGLAMVRFRCITDMPALGPVDLAEAERVRRVIVGAAQRTDAADAVQ